MGLLKVLLGLLGCEEWFNYGREVFGGVRLSLVIRSKEVEVCGGWTGSGGKYLVLRRNFGGLGSCVRFLGWKLG